MGYYSVVAETAHTESSEKYQFSLPINEVLPFAEKCSFDIVAKKSSMDMLEGIGRKDSAEFYRKNQNIREYYYVLTSQNVLLNSKKSIEDVPEMKIDFSPIPVEEESSCLQM